jgi:hypothetical protein
LGRVDELRNLIIDPSAPNAYFRDFDASLRDEPSKKQVWLARERVFQCLDQDSWEFLKREAEPYLTKPHSNGRAWEQLIAILNQAYGHVFFTKRGYSRIRFIPGRVGTKTPELEAETTAGKVLCEVKTINASDFEIARRAAGRVGSTRRQLDEGLFRKVMSDLRAAKAQMNSYDAGASRLIAYVVINFDDSLAEYKADYFQQIDNHLAQSPVPGVEVVFHNQRTAFHVPISMKHATVVDEP